jgi:hypothetical protein
MRTWKPSGHDLISEAVAADHLVSRQRPRKLMTTEEIDIG